MAIPQNLTDMNVRRTKMLSGMECSVPQKRLRCDRAEYNIHSDHANSNQFTEIKHCKLEQFLREGNPAWTKCVNSQIINHVRLISNLS
ncbi:MAG: hypothetical protein JWM11_5509 [Planctomycetaceae bacterium]|nr:hypothetical protein [Planctomycetaceae bacterium]